MPSDDGERAGRRPAVFSDRDGILNELVLRDGHWGSPRLSEEFRLREDAPAFVKRLGALGLPVFVVSNQPDIARGHLDPLVLAEMTRQLRAALAVEEVVVCPHDDADGCACRKPRPGMLLDLADRHGLDLARSFMVGDTWRDVEAGRRASCRTIRVGGEAVAGGDADFVVSGLMDAAGVIGDSMRAGWRNADGIRA